MAAFGGGGLGWAAGMGQADLAARGQGAAGLARLWSVLLVSVLVGLATVAGLILLVIPGISIGCGWPSGSRPWWWPG
jgi:hypothetical protein